MEPQPERLDPASLDQVLRSTLEQHPDAPLAAITPEGVFRELPEGFDPGTRPVLGGGSALDFVQPEDRTAVIGAWQQAHEVGASRTMLHSASDPSQKITLHLVDSMHRFGVFFAVIVPGAGASVNAVAIEPVRDPTRMARTQKDQVSTIIDVDAGTTELLGFERDEIVGQRSLDLIHPDDHDRAIDCWMAMLTDPGGVRNVRLRHLRKDGSYVWVDISNRNLIEEKGCVVADMIDVSDEMAAQEALREREQLLARLTEALPLGVLQIDDQRRVVLANQSLYEIVGADPTKSFDEMVVDVVEDDRPPLEAALTGVLDDGKDQDLRLRVRRGRSELRHLQVGLRALRSESGKVTGAVGCVEDITESVRLHVELENRATLDALTGCLNRSAIMSALDDVLTSKAHAENGTALIFFDVDNFKAVNDRFGHMAGDEVLRTVVHRTATVVRRDDVVGRLGGDEFLVICPGIGDEETVMAVASRMSEEIAHPVDVDGEPLEVRISIGVVWCDGGEVAADWLVGEADRLMYEAKQDGRGRPLGRKVRADR